MQTFTSNYNEKEITFTDNGIRYNNEIFIAYRDMRDISHRTEGQNALVFRYKDRLVRLPYNPDDKPEIMPFLSIAMQQSKDAEREEEEARKRSESAAAAGITLPDAMSDLDKYSYLDAAPQPPQMADPQPKKKHTGLIIGLVVAAVIVAAVVVILLIR